MSYLIHTSTPLYATPERLEVILKHHKGATFVEEIAVKIAGGGWSQYPVMVFHQETPPQPEYPKYFCYQHRYKDILTPGAGGSWLLIGLPTFDPKITAYVTSQSGQKYVTYSRYAHDYVQTPGGPAIDGGRDYARIVGDLNRAKSVEYDLLTKTFMHEGTQQHATR